ncbi:MAG: helix-turn-helix domain-containing protein [bacterium]
MARIKDKSKAIELRKKGMSYSQIKAELGISKGTLNGWLYDMPLSDKRIRELRDFSPMRIEKCRNTKMKKRQSRLDSVYQKALLDIGKLSKRDIFLAGLFLYWGEGSKTSKYCTALTNTDPVMVKFFIKWVTTCFNIKKTDLDILLHLYEDMNIKKATKFWSKELDIPLSQFKKPYIKTSKLSGLSYKNGFGKGTCNVRISGRDLAEYVSQSLKYMRDSV